MTFRRGLAASMLALAPLTSGALDLLDSHIVRTVAALERGYAQAMGQLSTPDLEQPSALTMTNPYAAGARFPPRPRADMSWQFQGVSEDESALCLTVTVAKAEDWSQAVLGLTRAGMQAATSGCALASDGRFASTENFPAQLTGIKYLSRSDIPVPTVLPTVAFSPQFQGVDADAVTRPGVLLFMSEGDYEITVTNPAMVIGPGPTYRTLTLVDHVAREGFSVLHDCTAVPGDGTCTILVSYDGSRGDYLVGSLRLEFDTGDVAVIGLLGRSQ